MLELVNAGIESFDAFTAKGRFAGMIIMQPRKAGKHWTVAFDSNATRCSARKFNSVQDAANFIVDRRIKKGLPL